MCGKSEDESPTMLAECASHYCNSPPGQSEVHSLAEHISLLETRLGFISGVRQSLAGPVTALVAQVEACLCLLEQIVQKDAGQGRAGESLSCALELLRNASSEGRTTVELLQHLKSIQQMVPRRKAYVSLGRFAQECITILHPRLDTWNCTVEAGISSVKFGYVDQFGLSKLLERILLDLGTMNESIIGGSGGLDAKIDCYDDWDDVIIRIRQTDRKRDAEAIPLRASSSISTATDEQNFRGITQTETEEIARRVQEIGGNLRWSLVTDSSLDFGMSFLVSSVARAEQ